MKYFTIDCYNAWYPGMDGRPLHEACAHYLSHLHEMEGVLPAHVLELARLNGTDDGLVVRVQHDHTERVLTLVLRCGDNLMGYYNLVLTYEEASLSAADEWTLAQVARTTKSDCIHVSDLWLHELDCTKNGEIEHRLLFHPGVWFAIRCRALRWERFNRPDRQLPRLKDRFPGGPLSPPDPVGGEGAEQQ